jgi:hypothetical protein
VAGSETYPGVLSPARRVPWAKVECSADDY